GGGGVEAPEVVEGNAHRAGGAPRQGGGAAVKTPQNEQRRAVRRSDTTFARDTSQDKPLFEQRRHGGKTVGRLERLRAFAFVEDNTERCLVLKRHGSLSRRNERARDRRAAETGAGGLRLGLVKAVAFGTVVPLSCSDLR